MSEVGASAPQGAAIKLSICGGRGLPNSRLARCRLGCRPRGPKAPTSRCPSTGGLVRAGVAMRAGHE